MFKWAQPINNYKANVNDIKWVAIDGTLKNICCSFANVYLLESSFLTINGINIYVFNSYAL